MCEVCAIFGAGEHWSDFGRARNETFPFRDIRFYRQERARRLALLGHLLAPLGISVGDWDGEAAVVGDRHGRTRIAATLGDVWTAAEGLSGSRIDPLDPAFCAGLGATESQGAAHV
jgi:hypothetical protein